jgi:hypothetical protein
MHLCNILRRYARFFDKSLKWSRPCLVECMFCANFTIDRSEHLNRKVI